MDVDWACLVLQPQWLQRLDKLALKRFTQQGLAEEASTYVLDKLSADNWACCQQYAGNAKAETYVLTLTTHLLEEFSRKRFGRVRPPEWLKREGELWIRTWKMICMERQATASVIDQLTNSAIRSTEFVQGMITTIKARLPWCGQSAREIPANEDTHVDNPADRSPSDSRQTLETALDHDQMEDALLLVHQLLLSDDCPSEQNEDTHNMHYTAEQWQQLREHLSLDEEERLLLKMVYQQGLKLKVVAGALNMPDYQPGRLLKAIHQRIRDSLQAAKIEVVQ